jgi:hypothetical protein
MTGITFQRKPEIDKSPFGKVGNAQGGIIFWPGTADMRENGCPITNVGHDEDRNMIFRGGPSLVRDFLPFGRPGMVSELF